MSDPQVWAYVLSASGALAVALVGVVLLGVFMEGANRLRGRLFPLVFPLIGLAVVASSLLSGRNLSDGGLWAMAVPAGGGMSAWLLRLITLTVLAVSAAQILTGLIRRDAHGAGGRLLLIAFSAFFAANVVLNGLFGTRPAFIHNLYYPLIVIAAAHTYRGWDVDTVLRWAKSTLLVLLVLSLVAAVLRPDLALERGYRGWIPGLNARLWGVGSNANSIGPLALLYLLLAVHRPFQTRWLRYAGTAAALMVLLLAQSKTTFAAAIVAIGVMLAYRNRHRFREIRATGRVPVALVAAFAACMLLLAAAIAMVVTLDVAAFWQRFITSREGVQFLTLTGRDVIWGVALNEWERNPLFGYGPTMWDPEFRRAIGLSFAFSAHNQFLQSMGMAGTVGLVGLGVYVTALAIAAFRAAERSRGLSLALFLFIAIRCMTEAPLTTNTIFNGDFLTHLLLFMVVSGGVRGAAHGRADGSVLPTMPDVVSARRAAA